MYGSFIQYRRKQVAQLQNVLPKTPRPYVSLLNAKTTARVVHVDSLGFDRRQEQNYLEVGSWHFVFVGGVNL